jgi:FAD/FMN-containing dehydrogenase
MPFRIDDWHCVLSAIKINDCQMHEWVNWSGSLRFKPGAFIEPRDENELRDIVSKTHASGKRLRLAAAGHSSSPLVKTNETLVHLAHFRNLIRTNEETMNATLQAGMTVHETAVALQKHNLALFNTGDVDVQTLAGAISTGTHGTGKKMQNLSSLLVGVRLIDYKGDIKIFNEKEHPDVMRAMRVSLGALGIFTEINVKTLPLFKLHRLEVCTDIGICLDNFDQLGGENRNVDFYWYPRSDEAKIRVLNEPGKGTQQYDFKHNRKNEEVGWVGEILPRHRDLKFDETEFALSADNGLACFQAIRKRIKEKHRRDVAWRVLVRTIAADDNYLSPHHGRDSIAISVHHNAGLPFEMFFKDLEPIFVEFGGRPHWAKKHWRKGADLVSLYPEWETFQKIRRELDPEGFFLNDHLKEIFNL